MRRLMTGVLVAALLISQTSIADVFVKTDAATAMAAEDDAQPGDEAADVTVDEDTSDSQTEEEDVEEIIEEVTPDENTEQEEEEIPENPEVIPGTEAPETETPEIEEDETVIEEEETEEEEDLLTEAGIALLALDDELIMPLVNEGKEGENEFGEDLDQNGEALGEGIKAYYDSESHTLTIAFSMESDGRLPNFSFTPATTTDPEQELNLMAAEGGSDPEVPWKDYSEEITKVQFIRLGGASGGEGDEGVVGDRDDSANSVTYIGAYAFANLVSLTDITIPSSVTGIGAYAFYNCSSLSSINIPDGIEAVSDYVFANTSLESVTIPKSVTTIGDHAFEGCTSLTSVTAQGMVANIGSNAFQNCSSLRSIDVSLLANAENIGSTVFAGLYGITLSGSSDGTIVFTRLKSLGGSALNGIGNLEQVMYQDDDEGTLESEFNSYSFVQIKYEPVDGGIKITKITRAGGVVSEHSVVISNIMADESVVSVEPDYRKYVVEHPEGHEPVLDMDNAQTKEATCTEDGTITAECLICGVVETKTIEEATGHDFTTSKWYHDDKEHWKECSVCGEKGEHGDHTVPGTSCEVCDKYAQSEKDPNQPGEEDPNQPGGEGPDQPGGEGPDQPGVEDPDQPDVEDPNQPGNTPVTPQPSTPQPPATGGDNGGSSGSGSSSSGSSSSSGTTSNQSSSANAATSAPAETTTVVTYTVESGDTLSKIALKYYGSSSYWTKIYADNADTIKDPGKIYVGQILKIYLTQNNGAAATAGAPVAGTNYTVVSGDSLSKIAQKVYGQSGQWRKIYDANAGTITDPNRIYVGQVIVIPE